MMRCSIQPVVTLACALLGCAPAHALLTYSYYSDQIIVTTDERRTGPIDDPPEVGPNLAACWRAPHPGDQVTVQLSFRRDGSVLGKPKINYVKPGAGGSGPELAKSILQAIGACTPLSFTPELAAEIAGEVYAIRFIAR